MKPKIRPAQQRQFATYLALIVAVIMMLLPFHAFFTTWLGSAFGHIDVFRVWKETIIAILGVGCLVLIYLDAQLRKKVLSNFILQAIFSYVLYSVLRALYGYASGSVNLEATLYGIIVNLRYPVFFAVVWVICHQTDFLKRTWQQIVLIPGAIVVGFGLLQQFLLPKDFLSHFGYSPETIPAYQAVDQKPNYVRIQSTLRGANPLGAYLVFFMTFITTRLVSVRNWLNIVLAITTIITLFFTYSRSAWLGLFVSLGVICILLKPRLWKKALVVLAAALIVGSSLVYAMRDNDTIQNIVFHSDETSRSATSSNEVRYSALSSNVKDVITHPLGTGVGSAGPASFRNDQPARIAENYFIQIGQEVGIIGLLLYIVMSLAVAKGLWVRRKDTLAAVLFASLIGITVINMISHAWTDDTLSLLWWGLAGISLASPVILKVKHHGTKKN